MKNKLLILAMIVISTFVLSGCTALLIKKWEKEIQAEMQANKVKSLENVTVILTRYPQDRFYGTMNGIVVHVLTTQPVEENIPPLYHLSDRDCFTSPTAQYVREMGLNEMSPVSDNHLYVTIVKADVDLDADKANVEISVSLNSAKGNDLFSQKRIVTTAIGGSGTDDVDSRNSRKRKPRNWYYQGALDEAYTQALEQINWNHIVTLLRMEQQPKDEPQNQVQGYGETALENTIIRWDVQSRPQGADIFWRVVSKTPEVKSTNNKYLQTTPYEATKSLDIRGLTYQTSGDVRIILRCEKDGYMPQEKEYSVRMIIDQEEISAFFRLVKEE